MYLRFNSNLNVSNFIGKSYTFNFQSNGTNYTEMSFSETSVALLTAYIMSYNSTTVGLTYVQVNKITPGENYRCIYIEDSELDRITDTIFKRWLLTNTTKCSGYFQELNGIHYFVDMKDSPDTSIQDKFNTNVTLNKYKPLITPVTDNYISSNFDSEIFDCFYISFEIKGTVKYLSIVFNNGYYEFTSSEILNYSCYFYLESIDNKSCLKWKNTIDNVEKYIIGKEINDTYYITFIDSISGLNPDWYAFIDSNNKLVVQIDSNYVIGFTGEIVSWAPELLFTTTLPNKQVTINQTLIPINLTQQINYRFKDSNNQFKNLNFLPLEVHTYNINGSTVTCLPYQKLPTITSDADNIFSGNWLVDNIKCVGLTYLLPNTTTYIPLYYKRVTITNETSIAKLPIMIGERSSSSYFNTQYITDSKETSLLNTNNTSKTFITSVDKSLNEWHNWYCYIDYTDTDIRDADRVCYLNTSAITSAGWNINDVNAFNLSSNNLKYKFKYTKFTSTSSGVNASGIQYLSASGGTQYATVTAKLPAYLTPTPPVYTVSTFTNIITLPYVDYSTIDCYIGAIKSSVNLKSYQGNIESGGTIELDTGWETLISTLTYHIYGCPKFIQVTS